MHVISKLTLHRGTKSVTVFVREEDRQHLIAAALALAVDYRAVEYTRDRTLTGAWKNFLKMRLALHEHRAAPAPETA